MPHNSAIINTATDWDARFLAHADTIAAWSKDRSCKVGCIIVGPDREIRASGYNGFPRGANDGIDARHERPLKYKWAEHAERNALYNCVRTGVSAKGCTMYSSLFPCADCARGIIQSGIATLVCAEPDWNDERWGESFLVSREMLEECGVNLVYLSR